MKKEILNGSPIPYDLSTESLEKMLSSPIMKDFSLACEALSYKNDNTAYQIMKSYIHDKDKYRRLYILKTIFRHPQAIELIDYLESAIASEDFLFVGNGLLVISQYKIKVPDALLLSVIQKNLSKLSTEISALKITDISEENYVKMIALFESAKQCLQKEIIAGVLTDKYLPAKSKELFELFSRDEYAKIGLLAIVIAEQYGFDASIFFNDKDGHVRKFLTNTKRKE